MPRQKAVSFFDSAGGLRIWQSRIWRGHVDPGTRNLDKRPPSSLWLWGCFFLEWLACRWMLLIGFFIARWLRSPTMLPVQQASWTCLPMHRREAQRETFPWVRRQLLSIACQPLAQRRANTLP